MGSKTSKIVEYEARFKDIFENDLKNFSFTTTLDEGYKFIDYLNQKYKELFTIGIKYNCYYIENNGLCKVNTNIIFNYVKKPSTQHLSTIVVVDESQIGYVIYNSLKSHYRYDALDTIHIGQQLASLSTKKRNAIFEYDLKKIE